MHTIGETQLGRASLPSSDLTNSTGWCSNLVDRPRESVAIVQYSDNDQLN